ncbi:hypothetical protein [Nocardia sp. R7R-8]|uniref:hypothetical protein n=1 Tax=Nocardia sp. R7R-8 TaxID=3459304 RepID=UPI00403D6836
MWLTPENEAYAYLDKVTVAQLLPPSSPSPSRVNLVPGERNYVSVQVAEGRWSDECGLAINHEIETPYYEDKLTAAQIAGIKDGSVYALLIVAACGKG